MPKSDSSVPEWFATMRRELRKKHFGAPVEWATVNADFAAKQVHLPRWRYHDWDDVFVGMHFVTLDNAGKVEQIGRITSRRNDCYSVKLENLFALALFGIHAPSLIQGEKPFVRRIVSVDDALSWVYFDTAEERDAFAEARAAAQWDHTS